MRLEFRESFDVIQNAVMDGVNYPVRPEGPIVCRPQGVMVPGSSFKEGMAVWKRLQEKLTLLRNHKTAQVGRMNLAVWSPFLHRFRVMGDGEFQQVRLIPYFDGFDKRSRGKNAITDRSGSTPPDLRAQRICDSELK